MQSLFTMYGIPRDQEARAEELMSQGQASRVVDLCDRGERLQWVHMNHRELVSAGLYETALLRAMMTGVFFDMSNRDVRELMYRANRPTLRSLGHQLPPAVMLKAYRGVAGRGQWRRRRGYCWTLNPTRACWFALEHRLSDPELVSVVVHRSDVWAFWSPNGEQDLIIDQREDQIQTEPMTPGELMSSAKTWGPLPRLA